MTEEVSVDIPKCTSCHRIIPPGDSRTNFQCPNCGEMVMWRCSRCRKFGRSYRCPKCGFIGP